MQIDNSAYDGIMNRNIQQKCSIAMYVKFYWVIDSVKKKHFEVFWKPVVINLGGYFTKHHSPSHHK